jgi:PleD family two-component response regulator
VRRHELFHGLLVLDFRPELSIRPFPLRRRGRESSALGPLSSMGQYVRCMKKILLIEDDPDIQDLVQYSLSQEGFAVQACGDGTEGLLSARRDRPDLILLDVMLPGLTGNEVCKKLKA